MSQIFIKWLICIFDLINHKSIEMKQFKILLFLLLVPVFTFSQVFDIEQVKVNPSMMGDYEKFEGMWANAHEEIHKIGNKIGWFLFKVVPNSNQPKPGFDYVILNFYKDAEAKKAGWGVKNMQTLMKKANYGKIKSSEVKRLSSLGGKIKSEVKGYSLSVLDATIEVGSGPAIGNRVTYHGVKALNDDYENYEMKWFKDGHNQDIIEGRRLAWYFNKVDSSTDNADKSMTHVIFERFNPSAPQREAFEPTFEQQMMWKHGGASREFIENATLELVNFRSSLPQ